MIGLRPKLAEHVQPLAQFLAAFPANLLFPLFVIPIVAFHLNADIWLTPLMILGTQWYILFNVIAGTTAYPDRLSRIGGEFPLSWLAVVADRDPAGHLSLLCDRRDYRLRRRLECQHRRGGRITGGRII